MEFDLGVIRYRIDCKSLAVNEMDIKFDQICFFSVGKSYLLEKSHFASDEIRSPDIRAS